MDDTSMNEAKTTKEKNEETIINGTSVQSPGGQTTTRVVVDLETLRDWITRGNIREDLPVEARPKPSGNRNKPRTGETGGKGYGRTPSPSERPVQPAKVFVYGDVLTKVWVNHRAPGNVTWNVQQVRAYRFPKGTGEAHSFRPDDLRDVIRGAYQARRWIRKNERRFRLLGWFLGY